MLFHHTQPATRQLVSVFQHLTKTYIYIYNTTHWFFFVSRLNIFNYIDFWKFKNNFRKFVNYTLQNLVSSRKMYFFSTFRQTVENLSIASKHYLYLTWFHCIRTQLNINSLCKLILLSEKVVARMDLLVVQYDHISFGNVEQLMIHLSFREWKYSLWNMFAGFCGAHHFAFALNEPNSMHKSIFNGILNSIGSFNVWIWKVVCLFVKKKPFRILFSL